MGKRHKWEKIGRRLRCVKCGCFKDPAFIPVQYELPNGRSAFGIAPTCEAEPKIRQ